MTYKVRLAEIHDVDWIVKEAGRRMTHEELKKPDLYDPHTLQELALKGIREQTVILVTKHTKIIGVIGGVLVPHYLNRNQMTLAEIMWYVLPEHRSGRAGLLLLKAFTELAKDKAAKATLSLLGSSPISDKTLEKFGFKLTERNYLMEN